MDIIFYFENILIIFALFDHVQKEKTQKNFGTSRV